MGRLTPLGMVLGGPTGAIIGSTLSNSEKNHSMNQEEREYHRIKSNWDKILSQPIQEIHYVVDASNTPLPQDTRNFLMRFLLFPSYDFPREGETKSHYLKRIMLQESLFSGEGTQQVYSCHDSLWLEFYATEREKLTEKRKVVLFEPNYTEREKLEAELQFEIDKHFLKYVGWSIHRPKIKGKFSGKPDKVQIL